MSAALILKRASASRPSGQWRDDDYEEDGVPPKPGPCGAFFLALRFSPAHKEIFHDELAIYRRERLLADPAMDQSMREVGVIFHAHHLVARPAAGADKLSRIVLSHYAPLDNCPYRTLDAIKG